MTALPTRVRPWRAALLAIAAIAGGPLLAPSVASADDTPPIAHGGSVEPGYLDFYGGEVTIVAEALDDVGIASVSVNVTGPDGFYRDVALTASQIPASPTEPTSYVGAITLPGNTYAYTLDYQFNSTVTDTAGQSSGAYLGQVTISEVREIDEPPYLWEPTLSTRTLPSSGGPVTFGISAYDDTGVASASAKVTGPAGYEATLDLSPVNETVLSGTLNVPANATTAPAIYTVTFTTWDDISQSASLSGGTFTVAATNAPPLGQLQVTPAYQLVGPVFAGQTVRRNVIVKNLGRPGSGPVTATATTGGLFTIVGAGPFGQPLELDPGQSRVLVVEFRPKRGGVFPGRVTVTRPDGRQRPQIAQLTGLALP